MTEPRYKVERGPERLSFDSYAIEATKSFNQLLSSHPTEPDVQRFLEHHPAMVPGARTPGLSSGHFPLHWALITQPRLPGFHSKVPDFMWIATHSGTWYPTLIEIEDPKKRLFTKAGQQTAQFSQAKNQLDRWRSWFAIPANVQVFMDQYGIPSSWRRLRNWRLHMILIFGRRAEFDQNPDWGALRASIMPSDAELVSFDRLTPDANLQLAITIRALGDGKFKAVWIPATYGIAPDATKYLQNIDGLEQAIDANSTISSERKFFLKKRIDYWLSVGAPKGGPGELFTTIE
jgi:hypothetical protein